MSTEKSYVTLEPPSTPTTLLLDRRLRKTFERHTVTGFSLCPKDEQKFKQGYVAIEKRSAAHD